MNGDEVQVVMEACECRPDLVVLFQVRSSWRQQVWTTLHLAGEGVLGQAHANGGHLGGKEGGLDPLGAPLVHVLLPVGELFRVSLRNLVLNLVGSLADLPEEAPLGVGDWDGLAHRCIFAGQAVDQRLVVAGLLNTLGSDAGLVAKIGPAVLKGLASVIFLTDGIKVLLDHVDVVVVVLRDDARVLEDDDAESVERLGNLIALLFPAFGLLQVHLGVDHRNLFFLSLHYDC